ncbi:hypothetical protein F7725_016047 [Dissostichus mawsoni]|uniref:Uncharacterized protein n=1 Tax=Dissostichus mawsoni TaxID=36200 RepID=A0A7J5Y5D9_DISMA|nr:hypothetical protein F7725_016047 [Dissostichus mawsoni]
MQTYSISGYATETTLVAKQMEGLLVHNPHSTPPPLPHFPSSPTPQRRACPRDRVEGLGLHRARRGLDGSLVVGGVVAPVETHTVLLLLVEQVGRLVGDGYGHGRGGAGGAGGAGVLVTTTVGVSTPSWSSVSVSSILVNSLSVDCGVLSIRDAITAFWYCWRCLLPAGRMWWLTCSPAPPPPQHPVRARTQPSQSSYSCFMPRRTPRSPGSALTSGRDGLRSSRRSWRLFIGSRTS